MTRHATPIAVGRTVGICMAAAPAVLLVGELMHPDAKRDAAAQLQVLSTSADRQYAAHAVFLVALILFVPALHALAQVIAATRAAWGRVGLVLGVAGTVGLAAFAGAELVTWQVGKAATNEAAAMTALLERLNTSSGFFPLLILSFAFPIGFVVIGAGLYLSRAVATWQAVLIGAAPLLTLVAEFAYAPKPVIAVPAAAFVAGLGSVGVRMAAGRIGSQPASPI